MEVVNPAGAFGIIGVSLRAAWGATRAGRGMRFAPAHCTDMRDSAPVVRVLVRPGTNPRRPAVIARWVRWLLPAALLIVSEVTPDTVTADDDDITLDADDVDTGPLAIASAIQKALAKP